MMNRRSALRALAGAMAALPALLAAKSAEAQGISAIEVLPGQIGVRDADGASIAYWPTADERAELVEPRVLEIPGMRSVRLTIVDEAESDLVIINDLITGNSRLFIEDGG